LWWHDVGSMDPQRGLDPSNSSEWQKQLYHCQSEHWHVTAVCVSKQSCDSRCNNNLLQQEECPNLQEQSNKQSNMIFLGCNLAALQTAVLLLRHSPIGSPSWHKNNISSSVPKWKILTCSVNPMADKKDKKLDYSPCWTKVTKHIPSMGQSANFG
jgi:hypothetical protein